MVQKLWTKHTRNIYAQDLHVLRQTDACTYSGKCRETKNSAFKWPVTHFLFLIFEVQAIIYQLAKNKKSYLWELTTAIVLNSKQLALFKNHILPSLMYNQLPGEGENSSNHLDQINISLGRENVHLFSKITVKSNKVWLSFRDDGRLSGLNVVNPFIRDTVLSLIECNCNGMGNIRVSFTGKPQEPFCEGHSSKN